MKAHGWLRLATLSTAVALTFRPVAASADGVPRHPGPGAVRPPQGVPTSYVFTHNGWFHPSCVVRVGEDETVGADMVVRGRRDGAAHFNFSPCAYPRFDNGGHEMRGGAAAPAHLPPQAGPTTYPAGATYDGYIDYYVYYGKVALGPTLVGDEIVPPPPTDVADQDIAFFNGILTQDCILQPVLDFNGETAKKWSIESEECCINGNDLQTTPVVVSPGDTIRGTTTGTGCPSSGVCTAWAVTTEDVTTGKSTTLNTSVVNEAPNGINPASLETYGVTSCAMFPVGGETTFTGNTLTDSAGAVQTLKYDLLVMQGVAAEVPTNCGYGGKNNGNDFTLLYGPVTATGGTSGTGGSAGATGGSAGGKGGAAGKGGGAGGAAGGSAGGKAGGTGGAAGASAGTGGKSGTGGTTTSTGGSPGTTGGTTGSTGGSSGTGGTTTSTGGNIGNTGGTSGSSTGGSSGASGTGDTTGSSSSGCSCDASGSPTSGFSLMFAFVAAAIWNRRRRRT